MEPHACGLIFEEERLCVVDGDRRGKEVFAVSKLWVYRRLWQTAQFQSCAVTKYLSVERRIWVADRYAAQAGHGEQRQLCLALLLRDAQYAIDRATPALLRGSTSCCNGLSASATAVPISSQARFGQLDRISPLRMAEMLEVNKAGQKVRC
jgi:hypothetical protein